MDQPARAFDMVVRFIEGKPWGKEDTEDGEAVVAAVA